MVTGVTEGGEDGELRRRREGETEWGESRRETERGGTESGRRIEGRRSGAEKEEDGERGTRRAGRRRAGKPECG